MSIPPLVCSTPPPPDQCEEDKDHEDFDINYNLSQDEDDDYNFGNLSSYNNIQSSTDVKITENVEILTSCDLKNHTTIETIEQYNEKPRDKNEQHHGPNTLPAEIKCEEDSNIEDLELEINEECLEKRVQVENEVIIGLNLDSSVYVENEDHLRTLSPSPVTEDNSVESLSIEDKKKILLSEDVEEIPNFELDVPTEPHTTSVSETKQNLYSEILTNPVEETIKYDDDFCDFDDFQFASSADKPSPIIDTCNNPWDNNAIANSDFGSFTANFETDDLKNVISNPATEFMQTEVESNNEFENATDADDFGDFDDFKSSAVDNETNNMSDTTTQQGPGINFHLSDNESQAMESITNILKSIFEEEVTEPEIDFEAKLEAMLSETWRHLRETDVRQPYIVNWNNSLGQKTLLRALCIDSRNILFGPKWSYNMPKYAVNLSNAPLQPQKPLTPSNSSQSEPASSENTTTKPGGWVDPFTSDGQESCNNTEKESVVEVTPSDLDVFEAAISTKSDKTYSSTLNVQPLRQISLPDTHIFTPTDSETPRSKTIHYDSGPPVLLPQPVLETTKAVQSFTQNTITSKENNDDDDDDDDWEFQDFKGSSLQPKDPIKFESKPENISREQSVNNQTLVLQPIKMKPLIPSLNWPDPGEVKETFENFSDFVSKTTWDNEQSHITSPQKSKDIESATLEKNSGDIINEIEIPQVPQTESSECFDDEFDTFQSALPNKGDLDLDSLSRKTFHNIPNQSTSHSPSLIKNVDYTFPKTNSNKSDTSISVENTTRPNKALTQSLGITPTPELTLNKTLLPLGNSLLQPLPVNSNASQKNQKTAQILQPLSLESYSQINWPNPGIDLQDLSRFNPVETLNSLKTELSAGGTSKGASPVHVQKNAADQVQEDDIWGEFVSSKPKQTLSKKAPVFVDDDEWTDFVSSPSVNPQNGLNTISFNVHTNSNIQKSSMINKFASKNSKASLDIPTLNYITPKSSGHNAYNERHFQNL